ncbi:MAG: AAA family ATPase [Candidatus Omnitrophica bacterium]|nr:AAA family ATPase [Candidatus Omnitrophota bacterium]
MNNFNKQLILRIISLSTAIVFLFQSTVYGEAPAITERSIEKIIIPGELASVKSSSFTGGGDIIVHIQDAHCDLNGQLAISKILEYLEKRYALKDIYLEGGSGGYDLSIFKSIADTGVRRQVSEKFLAMGEISAAEYYAVNADIAPLLQGVEDPELYIRNLDVYRGSKLYRDKALEIVNAAGKRLDELKTRIMGKELLELETKYAAYSNDSLKIRDYLAYLFVAAAKTGCDIGGLPEGISRLKSVLDSEEKVNFGKAEIDREKLLGILLARLPETRKEDLVRMVVAFKRGEISGAEFYGYLTKRAEESGVDVSSQMKDLVAYAGYVRDYAEIDRSSIMDGIEALKTAISEKFITRDEERTLIRLDEGFGMIKKIFNFSVTSSEYKKALSMDIAEMYGELEALNGKGENSVDAPELKDYFDRIKPFYEHSLRRDEVFIGNIPSGNKGSAPRVIALVTGGFHSENLYELFKKRGFSYISVIPEFSISEGENRYFDILSGEQCGLSKRISAAVSSLQVASKLNLGLGTKIWGERGIEDFEAALYTEALAESGYRVEITDESTGEVVFSNGDEKNTLIKIGKNRFLSDVHQEFIDKVMTEDEKNYRDLNPMERSAAERAVRDIIAIMPDTTTQDRSARSSVEGLLGVKALTGKEGIRVSLKLEESRRDGHAGGWGIRIREELTDEDAVYKVIRHEILAGLLRNHSMVGAVEGFMDTDETQSARAFMADAENRHEGMNALWDIEDNARHNIERDHSTKGGEKEIKDEDVREILAERKFLEPSEREELVRFIMGFHKDYDKYLSVMRSNSPDPARYKISIREIKRFAVEVERIFKKVLSEKETRVEALSVARGQSLFNVYLDFVAGDEIVEANRRTGYKFPDVELGVWSQNLITSYGAADRYYVDGLARKGEQFDTNIFQNTERKLGYALESGMPSLFIKNDNSLGAFEQALSKYVSENNAELHSMQCTPYSDTTQLLGGYVPRERVNKGEAYKIIEGIIGDDAEIRGILEKLLSREPLDKEIRDFKELYAKKEADGLIIAAAMVKKNPDNWRKKLVYEKGLLARIIEKCNKEGGKTFILNLENVEALPGRVRAQLNTFLLNGEMRVPGADSEEMRKLVMPSNLRIIATMGEGSVLEDGAFYDRFVRKSVGECDPGDLREAIERDYPGFPESVVKLLIITYHKFREKGIECTARDFLNISGYVYGRAKNGSVQKMFKAAVEEIIGYFTVRDENRYSFTDYAVEIEAAAENSFDANFLRKVGPSIREMDPFEIKIEYSKGRKELVVNGIGLPVRKEMGSAMQGVIDAMNKASEGLPEELAIKQALVDELDFVLTKDSKKMLWAVARAYKYGNGFVCLEGVTGAGKTYTAEMLSKLIDFKRPQGESRFYSEPVDAQTKISRYVGMFRTDEYGYYSLDKTTPFLDIIENGGVAAISEMNTAVKDDYAKLGWWFNQFARGDEVISLTEYPGYGPLGAMSRTVKRNPRCIVIVDINPEDYEARGKLPEELRSYAQRVSVSKTENKDDLEFAAWAFLKQITDDRKRWAIAKQLALYHQALEAEVIAANGRGERHPPLSFRELKRICKGVNNDSDVFAAIKDVRALIGKYYIPAFRSKEKQAELRDQFGIKDYSPEKVVEELILAPAGERSPPAMVFTSAEDDPMAELDTITKDKDMVTVEKTLITLFIDEFKLLGGYVPVSNDLTPEKAAERIGVYSKEAPENIGYLGELFQEIAQKPLPADLEQLTHPEVLSLAAALDSLRNGRDWREKLRWERGIIPRLMKEARENPTRTYILALENFHRIRPGVAVALNSILQEGEYYDPVSKKKETVPPNLRFYATAIEEAELPISMAEESRWVRIHKGMKTQGEKKSELIEYARKLVLEKINAGELQFVGNYSPIGFTRSEQALTVSETIVSSIGDEFLELFNVPQHKEYIDSVINQAFSEGPVTTSERWIYAQRMSKYLVYGAAMKASDKAEHFEKGKPSLCPRLSEKDQDINLYAIKMSKRRMEWRIYAEFIELFDRNFFDYISEIKDMMSMPDILACVDGIIEEYAEYHESLKPGMVIGNYDLLQKISLRQINKYISRNCFDNNLADKTPMAGSTANLLEEVDELVEIEAATFQAFKNGKVVIYEGAPGGGKTDMGIDVANRMGLKNFVYSCHGRVHSSDLLGGFRQDKRGNFIFTGEPDDAGNFKYNPFLQMLTHGGVFIFDEGAIGKRSQELLSLLSGIARGDKDFFVNELPGKPARKLEVHKDFHIIITMNPAEDTPGREPLPLELYNHARRIWVPGKMSEESYRKIITRFFKDACARNKVNPEDIFASNEKSRKMFSDLITEIHFIINEMVGESVSLEESTNLHLLTLRDMKKLVKDFVKLYAAGVDKTEALRLAIRTEYLSQFDARSDRNLIKLRLDGTFLGAGKKEMADQFQTEKIYLGTVISTMGKPVDPETLKLIDRKRQKQGELQTPGMRTEKPLSPFEPGNVARLPGDVLKKPARFAKDWREINGDPGIDQGRERGTVEVAEEKSLALFDRFSPTDGEAVYWKETAKDRIATPQTVVPLEGPGELPADLDTRMAFEQKAFTYSETVPEIIAGKLGEGKGVMNALYSEWSITELYKTLKIGDKRVTGIEVIEIGGEECLVTSAGKAVQVWRKTPSGWDVTTLLGSTRGINVLRTIKRGGKTCIVTGSVSGLVMMWEPDGGGWKATRLYGYAGNDVTALAVMRRVVDGEEKECLVTGGSDGKIYLYEEGKDGWGYTCFKVGSEPILSLEVMKFKDKGNSIVAAGGYGTVKALYSPGGNDWAGEYVFSERWSTGSFICPDKTENGTFFTSGYVDNVTDMSGVWRFEPGATDNAGVIYDAHAKGAVRDMKGFGLNGENMYVSAGLDGRIILWKEAKEKPASGEQPSLMPINVLFEKEDVKFNKLLVTDIEIGGKSRKCVLAGTTTGEVMIFNLEQEKYIEENKRRLAPEDPEAALPVPEKPELPYGLGEEAIFRPTEFADAGRIFDREITGDEIDAMSAGLVAKAGRMVSKEVPSRSVTGGADMPRQKDIACYKTDEFEDALGAPVEEKASFSDMPDDMEGLMDGEKYFMYIERNKYADVLKNTTFRQKDKRLSELINKIDLKCKVSGIKVFKVGSKECIAYSDYNGWLRIIDFSTGTVLNIKANSSIICGIYSMEILQHGDETVIVTSGEKNKLRRWSMTEKGLTEGKVTVRSMDIYTGEIPIRKMRKGGKECIVVCGRDNTIMIIEEFVQEDNAGRVVDKIKRTILASRNWQLNRFSVLEELDGNDSIVASHSTHTGQPDGADALCLWSNTGDGWDMKMIEPVDGSGNEVKRQNDVPFIEGEECQLLDTISLSGGGNNLIVTAPKDPGNEILAKHLRIYKMDGKSGWEVMNLYGVFEGYTAPSGRDLIGKVQNVKTVKAGGRSYVLINDILQNLRVCDFASNTVRILEIVDEDQLHWNSIVGAEGMETGGLLVTCSNGGELKFWDLNLQDKIKYEKVAVAAAKSGSGEGDAFPSPSDEAYPEIELPEEPAINETRLALKLSGRVLLIAQPGAREKVIVDESAKREGIKDVYSIEGSPSLTVFDMFGGLFPLLEGEERPSGEDLVFKKGFFTRHMITEEEYLRDYGEDDEPRLLVIHNIDAVPEKVRAAVNNLLLNGFIEIPGEGENGRLYLPENIKIIATINANSQRDFSSAFPNRFTRVNASEMETSPYWLSQFVQYVMRVYGFDNELAGSIEMVHCMIKRLEDGGSFWPSGYVYGFTVKDALTAAKFISLGLKERAMLGQAVTKKDETEIAVREIIRAYGLRLKQSDKDYDNFVDLILKRIFDHDKDMVDAVSGEIRISGGKLSSISDIPVNPTQKGKHPYAIDKNYRLTMVKSIVRTISGVLRGFQAGKIVSLTGETGVAKTTIGVALAESLGMDSYVFSMHKDVKSYDFTAGIRATDAGQYRLDLSDFAEKLKSGNTVLVVDEANIKPEILWILSGIARGERKFSIEVPGEKPIEFRLGDNIYILFTMNPEDYEGGRDIIPQPVKEDIFNIWAPSEYPDPELTAIVNEFFDGYSVLDNIKEEKKKEEIEGMDLDERMLRLFKYLRHGYALTTIEDIVASIEEKGFKAALMEYLAVKPADDTREAKKAARKEAKARRIELKSIEKEMLERGEVKTKMDKIRFLVKSSWDIQKDLNDEDEVEIKFSLFTWWSTTVVERTRAGGRVKVRVIYVPLYELVKRKGEPGAAPKEKSEGVIAAVILHEFRHKLYSPRSEEYRDEIKPLLEGSLTPEEMEFFANLTREKQKIDGEFMGFDNLIEDIRINNIENPRLKGEKRLFNALLEHQYGNILVPEPDMLPNIFERAQMAPHTLLHDDLLAYGAFGRHSWYFDSLPDELREDIRSLTDGPDSPVYRATLHRSVKPDLTGVKSHFDMKKEKLRAEAERIKVFLKEINPVFQKWLKRAAEAPKDGEAGKGGAGGAQGVPSFIDLPPEFADMFDKPEGGEGEEGSEGGSSVNIVGEDGSREELGEGDGEGAEEGEADGTETPGGIEEATPSAGNPDHTEEGEKASGSAKPPLPGEGGEEPSRGDKFDKSVKDIEKKRKEELKQEPFNERLTEVSEVAKRLAKGFINIFRVPGEPDVEETPFGRIINAVRYIIGSNVPFDEDADTLGAPDLAFGMTIDASGSMVDAYPALKRLSAILLSAFQQIGNKAELSITMDNKEVSTIKSFSQKFKQEHLNAMQTKIEDKIGEGGNGIHLYDTMMEIINKYKGCRKNNKLEVIFTDAGDTGKDLYLDRGGKLCCTERLDEAFKKAKSMGITIIGVGFGDSYVEVFDSYLNLNKDNVDAIVGAMLSIGSVKAKTGKVPSGDLSEVLDLGKSGTLKSGASGRSRLSGERKYTVVKMSEAPKANNLSETRNLSTTVSPRTKAMSELWKNMTRDIVILPETELYTSDEMGARKNARVLDKKYAQTTVTFGYAYNGDWKNNLKGVMEKAKEQLSGDLAKGDSKTRAIVYVPEEADGDLMEAMFGELEIGETLKERITVVRERNLENDIPIEVARHITLGKVLLNYERFRKKDFDIEMNAGEISALIGMVRDAVKGHGNITLAFVEELVKGLAVFEAEKFAFTTITDWKAREEKFIKSV